MIGLAVVGPQNESIKCWADLRGYLDMQLFSTKHKVFWAVFLTAAAVWMALANSGLQRREHARRTADLLRPILAGDPRFQKVAVAVSTAGTVGLLGSVSSTNDLRDLQRLIDQTELPSRPSIGVRVISDLTNSVP